MAKAPKSEDAAAPPPKAKKKFLIIVVGVVLAVVILGGGAALLLHRIGSHVEEDGESQAKKSEVKAANHDAHPEFVRFEPFTVKLQPDAEKQEQYLQLLPEMKVLDPHVSEKLKAYMPELRHNMLLILSSKKPSELSTPQGVEMLASDIRNRVNSIIDGEQKTAPPTDGKARPDDSVQEVLFTSFIIQ